MEISGHIEHILHHNWRAKRAHHLVMSIEVCGILFMCIRALSAQYRCVRMHMFALAVIEQKSVSASSALVSYRGSAIILAACVHEATANHVMLCLLGVCVCVI